MPSLRSKDSVKNVKDCRREETVEIAALATAERDKKLIGSNPLVADNQKLVPSVTRVFRQDENMNVYLEAYQPTAEKTLPITATAAFYRGTVKAFESAPLRIADGLDPKSKAVPLRFSLPLERVQPGSYTCQVTVLQPGLKEFAVWRAPVVLLARQATQ